MRIATSIFLTTFNFYFVSSRPRARSTDLESRPPPIYIPSLAPQAPQRRRRRICCSLSTCGLKFKQKSESMTPLTIFLTRVFGVSGVYLRRSSLVGVYLRRPSLVAPVLISSNLRVLRRISLSTSNRQHSWSSGVASEHNQRTALAAMRRCSSLSQSDRRIPHSIHDINRMNNPN